MKDTRTDQELNRIIALWHGWTTNESTWWSSPDKSHSRPKPLPYCSDLNAVHEAEKKIPLSKRRFYYERLWCVCDAAQRMAPVGDWLVPTATARERAEALVRVIEEDK